MANVLTCAYTPTEKVNSDFDLKKFTNGKIYQNKDKEYYWNGLGILDVLLYVLGSNLKTQFDNGWITGNDYAQAYMKMMEIATHQAVAILNLGVNTDIQNRQLDQADSKNMLEACLKNHEVGAQVSLSERQVEGYDDNITIKLLQAELDAFALIYSSGMLDNPDLGPLKSSELTNCYNTLKSRTSKKARETQGV